MAERLPSKQNVASSNLVSRSHPLPHAVGIKSEAARPPDPRRQIALKTCARLLLDALDRQLQCARRRADFDGIATTLAHKRLADRRDVGNTAGDRIRLD